MPRHKYRPDLAEHLTELRKKAEAKLQGVPKTTSKLTPELSRLVHELEVHHFELEMQNEELRAARLETEAALARYTAIFEFAPIGYAALSADGTIREINHAGARLLGRERALLAGKKLDLYVPARDLWTWESLLRSALHAECSQRAEIELWHFDTPFFARLTAWAIEQPEPTVLLAIEDITEQRKRDRQLDTAEQAQMLGPQDHAHQQRQMDESLPLLVWGCGPEGACNYLSRQWIEYTGVTESQQHGSCWLDPVHPEDCGGARAAWESAVSQGATFEAEVRLRSAGGEHRWFRLRSTPIHSSQGKVVRWYGTALNIHDINQVHEEREYRTEEVSML